MTPEDEAAFLKTIFPLSLEEYQRGRSDVEWWCKHFAHFLDEATREEIQIVPNVLQRRAFAVYRARLAKRLACRLQLLKPRGRGGSSTIAAILYHHLMNFKTNAGQIGNKQESSINVFQIVKLLAQRDKFPWGTKITKDVNDRMHWAHNSRLGAFYTAGEPESARSNRLQAYHATECGRWPTGGALDASETLQSMQGALPKQGFHFVGEESTPNGAHGAFFERFMSARWPHADECPGGVKYWKQWESDLPQSVDELAPEHQYIRVFAPWYEFDGSMIPAEKFSQSQQEKIQETLDDDERQLIDRYASEIETGPLKGQQRLGKEIDNANLWQQLAWRRMMISTEFNGNKGDFDQEHPRDPVSCFLASGRPVFDADGIIQLERYAGATTPDIGNLTKQENGEVLFTLDKQAGRFQIFQHPVEGGWYAMGVDGAEGKSDGEGAEQDAHGLAVWRDAFTNEDGIHVPRQRVASMVPVNRVNPDICGEDMELLSLYFGGCIVVIERPGTAGGMLIQQAKMRELNLYHRKIVNPNTSKPRLEEGYNTNVATRMPLLSPLQTAVRDQEMINPDPFAIGQYKTFVQHEDGTWKHADGRHDDEVFADALAFEGLKTPTEYKVRRKRDAVLERLRQQRAGSSGKGWL